MMIGVVIGAGILVVAAVCICMFLAFKMMVQNAERRLTEAFAQNQVNAMTANANAIDALLKPFKSDFEGFKTYTNNVNLKRAETDGRILTQVGNIEKYAQDLKRTEDALKSNNQLQGKDGEKILESILEAAHQEQGILYSTQDSLSLGDKRYRPDAQVWDAKNQYLIIDSKVSLLAYFEAMKHPENSPERSMQMKALASGIRGQVTELGRKNYPEKFAAEKADRYYVPLTAMFVPFDAPLQAALAADPSLWQHAIDNRVVFLTPLTLRAYLRLLYYVWQQAETARNVNAIRDAALELQKRAVNVVAKMLKLKDDLQNAQKAYDEIEKLVTSPDGRTKSIACAINDLTALVPNENLSSEKANGKTPAARAVAAVLNAGAGGLA